jgi:hypothetical protein
LRCRHEIDRRSVRRQQLALRLYESGPRAVFEAMLELELGHDFDEVLASFTRISAETYHQVGAHALPIQRVAIIEGEISPSTIESKRKPR